MTFSFVVNGLFTFGARRLTWRHALLFVATTGVVLWVVQPLIIHGLLQVADAAVGHRGTLVLLVVKVCSIGVCFVANFAAYRYVVWPDVRRVAPSGPGG